MLSSNICAGFRNADIYPRNRDKVWPTIENYNTHIIQYHTITVVSRGARPMR